MLYINTFLFPFIQQVQRKSSQSSEGSIPSPSGRQRKPGAVIESFVNHAPGVFSGTFSGELHLMVLDLDCSMCHLGLCGLSLMESFVLPAYMDTCGGLAMGGNLLILEQTESGPLLV